MTEELKRLIKSAQEAIDDYDGYCEKLNNDEEPEGFTLYWDHHCDCLRGELEQLLTVLKGGTDED